MCHENCLQDTSRIPLRYPRSGTVAGGTGQPWPFSHSSWRLCRFYSGWCARHTVPAGTLGEGGNRTGPRAVRVVSQCRVGIRLFYCSCLLPLLHHRPGCPGAAFRPCHPWSVSGQISQESRESQSKPPAHPGDNCSDYSGHSGCAILAGQQL
ncbi:hypothetical protein SDC9_187481 [bioreactor metagenome]|uniref:Uncharacterized protein n=1 Tax=bioreactor metagenome TaxID=1076179 RepID=A0A645HLZ5_9ZZZZ